MSRTFMLSMDDTNCIVFVETEMFTNSTLPHNSNQMDAPQWLVYLIDIKTGHFVPFSRTHTILWFANFLKQREIYSIETVELLFLIETISK